MIIAAIKHWYDALNSDSVEITLTQNVVSSATANIIINYDYLDADPNTTCAVMNPTGSLTTSATITINANSYTVCFDDTASGYGIYHEKLMLHEFGHVFGMDDWPWPGTCSSYPGETVMAIVCQVNDSGGTSSPAITACDNTEIETIYASATGCGSGQGGGDGCGECTINDDCAEGDFCTSDGCCLYEGGDGCGECVDDPGVSP